MPDFKELAKAKIQDSRNLVISKLQGSNSFTLAQQLVVVEGTKQTTMFMKGAIHMEGLEALHSLRNALNEAIEQTENEIDTL